MKKIFKILIVLFIIGILIGSGIFWYVFHKPQRDVSGEDAVAKFESATLMKAFESNEQDANAKYLDKAIQVSGVIGEITSNENTITINLKVENVDFGGIKCTFDPIDLEKAKQWKVGDMVSIKGQCTGWINDQDLGLKEVSLTRCFVVE